VSKSNQLEFKNFPGVKEPKLDHKTILINRDGAIELLIKTRKRISSDVLYILKTFGIETTNRKCLTKEQQTLSAIANAFKTEKIQDQYKVDIYYLDLYFSEYKIVVECDENNHRDRRHCDERLRMDFVNETLNIDDTHWIRYNPDEYDFDISKVIGKIYIKITHFKDGILSSKLLIKELAEKERIIKEKEMLEKELEQVKLIHDIPELEIEPITGKFKAPPKEFLLEQIQTKSTLDIAQMFKISQKPVLKWLKEYNINPYDYRRESTQPPPKKELLNTFKTMNQSEVAEHYCVSVHIVRKWLKYYNLNLVDLTSKRPKITKKDILELLNDFTEEEIAEKLETTLLNIKKLLKVHSIVRIPTKKELQSQLEILTKDELADKYNTCRTTLRKWIRLYDLDHVRCTAKTHRPLYVTSEDGTTTTIPSLTEACKSLKMCHSKIREVADTGISYKGNILSFERVISI
jgi:transposase/very-short-patch-repair endonuclease